MTARENNNKQLDIWLGRLSRMRRRIEIGARDIERAADWYLLGGRRFFTRYYSEMRKSNKWCFIVGCNNSGTSLLQQILEESGQISTLPYEGMIYTRVLRRAGKRGYERVWTEYLDELRKHENEPKDCAPRLLHDWMRDLPLPIKTVIVEKTPLNAVRMRWLQKVFPRSYFIGLVRNGYAVAEGIHRKGGKSFQRGARHWNMVNKSMLKEAEGVEKFELIRYEDLVESPLATAAQLARFLELDRESIRAAMDNEFTFNTVKGDGPQRLVNMNEKTIARLSEDDKEAIRMASGEMLDYFGYEDF